MTCVVALGAGACSSGSGAEHSTRKPPPCPLIEKLDETAASVAGADVADPDAFGRTLDQAVATYVSTVRQLRKETPSELHDDLERIGAAVDQYRFQDAVNARAALDTFAAMTCGTATAAVPTTARGPTSSATTGS